MSKPLPAHQRYLERLSRSLGSEDAEELDEVSQVTARYVRRTLELEDTPQNWARIRAAILAGFVDHFCGPEPRQGR